MTKTQLSADLDLVKEIEQLKIKQKLLLKTLKDHEHKEEQEKILESMSGQIQFLVEIFKEVNSSDGKDIEEENKNQTQQISNKLDSIKTALFERMDLLEKKIDNIQVNSQVEDEIEKDPETISEEEIKEVLGEKEEVKVEDKLESLNKNSSNLGEIPKPDFEVKSEESNKEEETKKKGWFSK